MTRGRPALALALVCAAALALAGCSRAEPAPPAPSTSCPETDAGTPVDAALLAFLSSARAAHHLADAREEAGELPEAIAALRRVVDGKVPGGATPRAEAGEVLADTRARLADLESRRGEFDAADAELRAGLALATGTSYFRGHLFEVRGLVEQRRAAALEQSNASAAEVRAAKERAIAAFEQAMTIQNQVIGAAVPDGGGGR
ncbi:MAG: hypothetical protein OZ928_16515 [Polyangiaceae bacterium]|nr:hypothetical protein [Polyangiaceae bacterium]